MKPPIIKGDPNKPVKSTIDRTKYASLLSQPMTGTGTNMVSESPNAFTPAVLSANGYKYHSGSLAGKDIVYEKNGNLHLYNEQPGASASKYGLINIGNPNAAVTPSTGPLATSGQKAVASIDPNHKPLDLSNPNLTSDPNTGNYYNPVTGAQVKPIVESYSGGGPVKKAPKIPKGYLYGGDTDNGYQAGIANANAQNAAKKEQSGINGKSVLKGAGNALGAYGSQYYAQQPANNSGDQAYNATMTTVGSTGAIGGAVSGLSAIGNKIGQPIRDRSEKTDENGNLVSPGMAKRNAVVGSFFDPFKAITTRSSYKGGWTDISGNGYLKHLEDDAKAKINAQRQTDLDAENAKANAINGQNLQSALATREAGSAYDNSNIYKAQTLPGLLNTDQNSQYLESRGKAKGGVIQKKANGGPIKGPGTGISDSIAAKVKPGSFVVPAVNAPIAEELREKILKAPKVKANLKQAGGTNVMLSNGEHLFDPEEKQEIQKYGYDVDALAPNSDDGSDEVEPQRATVAGGKVTGYASGGPTAAKAKIMLKDNQANGEPLTGKQKRYFGWIAGGGKADGGDVEGYAGGGDVKKKQAEYRYLKTRMDNNAATGQERYRYQQLSKELKGNYSAPVSAVNPTKITAYKAAPKAPKVPFSRDWASVNPGPDDVPVSTPDAPGLAAKTTTPGTYDPNQESYDRDMAAIDNQGQGKKGNNFDFGKVIDYGIPAIQAGLGLSYLKKAGARPVDQLDPDYLRSIDTAKGNVALANANAKFGFSPEEQAAIDQQNAGLTRAGRFDARNFSGGSSANGLNMERSVINDSFARGLAAKVQNRNLIFQKQGIANDRQQYADSLIAGKVGMSNRLFNMKLDAWNQNQQTGAGLLNSAAQNLIGAKQWQDELKMSKDRANQYNPQPPTTV